MYLSSSNNKIVLSNPRMVVILNRINNQKLMLSSLLLKHKMGITTKTVPKS